MGSRVLIELLEYFPKFDACGRMQLHWQLGFVVGVVDV